MVNTYIKEYNRKKTRQIQRSNRQSLDIQNQIQNEIVRRAILENLARQAQINQIQQNQQVPQIQPQFNEVQEPIREQPIVPYRPTRDQMEFPSAYLKEENERRMGIAQQDPLRGNTKYLFSGNMNGTGSTLNGGAFRELFGTSNFSGSSILSGMASSDARKLHILTANTGNSYKSSILNGDGSRDARKLHILTSKRGGFY